jgi:hypothetical protein
MSDRERLEELEALFASAFRGNGYDPIQAQTAAKIATGVAALRAQPETPLSVWVLAWLGQWRDLLPPDAVEQLQDVCGEADHE